MEQEHEHTVELDIEVVEGRPVIEEIRLRRNPDAPAISGPELRRLPLSALVEFACREVGLKLVGPDEAVPLGRQDEVSEQEIAGAVRRRRRLDNAFLRDAVDTWRGHDKDPAATAEALHVSVSQLHRYLQRARAAGLADDYGKRD